MPNYLLCTVPSHSVAVKSCLLRASFVGAAAGASNVCFNSTQMKLRNRCTRKTLRRKRTERSSSWIHGLKLVCLLLWQLYPVFVFMAGNMIYTGWIMTPIGLCKHDCSTASLYYRFYIVMQRSKDNKVVQQQTWGDSKEQKETKLVGPL